MDRTGKIIAVTGSTGQQGNAAARHLLGNGWTVRALTRDLNKDVAKALADQGAEIVFADNEDRTSLDAAFAGAYGVFSVQNFWLPNVGAEGEVRQGKLIADAAQAASVQHFVYTSVGGAERGSGIPHFESKWEIEQHIQTLGLPATVVRPVAFMDNFFWGRPYILNGMFQAIGLRPETPNQLIAVDDIGAFVALAFDNPQEFIGQSVEFAGDSLTELQMADIFARVVGRPITITPPQGPMAEDPENLKMVAWFNESGYKADIPALRERLPSLHTLEVWLRETGWENAPAPDLSQVQSAWGN
jgi:uncharacterized protein YbjT (DUF2867 family)